MTEIKCAEGNLLQVESPFQIVRNKLFVRIIGTIDQEVSKMHEADAHVFSDFCSMSG